MKDKASKFGTLRIIRPDKMMAALAVYRLNTQ
jgi:hypothetical protein